jgi:hypothetical protein
LLKRHLEACLRLDVEPNASSTIESAVTDYRFKLRGESVLHMEGVTREEYPAMAYPQYVSPKEL